MLKLLVCICQCATVVDRLKTDRQTYKENKRDQFLEFMRN